MAYIVNVPKLRLGEKEIFVAGDRIDISPKLAEKLLKKAYIKFDQESKKVISTPGVQTEKLLPDGNAEKAIDFISEIDDVELLKRITLEEESSKNRKTVLIAIEEKIQELTEDEDDPDDGSDPKIKFDPEDVITHG